MVHPSVIESRLGELGFRTSRWFRAEVSELQHILMDDEKIIALACGRYFGSFALLVATDLRLLLIDKRVFFMTLEDTRYDMISEIDFNQQAYNATVTIYTMNKTHKFTSIKHRRQLRELMNYVQRRVWEFRQQQPSDSSPISQTRPALGGYQYQAVYGAQPQSQPLAAQPTDYYVDDKPVQSTAWREHAGQVAHIVGSAATRAAHHSPSIHSRSFHPYVQGSLMTRRPYGSPGDY
ncbi:MAG TPA: PH domain-containing protein [Candidatus Saccharimonadales bacterium]|nr:PH domain-containing protein [Candidatus Saccharimonadales bacterium]